MNGLSHDRLDEFRIKASLLLKSLNAPDQSKNENAARRLLVLPFLKHSTVGDVLGDKTFYRRKHALSVIAHESGFASWAALRAHVITEDCLFYNASPSFLNLWFNNYADAKAYHTANGGYLLQYRKDYVVAEKAYIEALGLDRVADDWQAIGFDWVKPADKKAWARIFELAKRNYLERKKIKHKAIDKSKRPAWLNNA